MKFILESDDCEKQVFVKLRTNSRGSGACVDIVVSDGLAEQTIAFLRDGMVTFLGLNKDIAKKLNLDTLDGHIEFEY